MSFIKRTFFSVIRNRNKTLILLVVIFILGNLIAGSIAVKNAVEKTEKTIISSLGAEAKVTVSEEYIKENEQNDKIEKISLDSDIVEKLANNNNVKYYEYNLIETLYSKEYEFYCGENCESGDAVFGNSFIMYGVQTPSLIDIKENKIKLKDGKVFNQDDIDNANKVVIVSSLFAEINNVHLGDNISLDAKVYDYNILNNNNPTLYSSKKFDYEVIGIYENTLDLENAFNSDEIALDYSTMQKLYLSNKSILEIVNWYDEEYQKLEGDDYNYGKFVDYIYPTFYLKDATQLEEFKNTADKFLPKNLVVSISSSAYDAVAGPISFISWLATGILYVSIGATILILGLVVILFLKDRRHEFGIYLSIGVRKWKIVTQVVLEVLLVGIIALTLSLFSGKELANAISQKMIEQQVINSNYNNSGQNKVTNVNQEKVLETYKVALDTNYVVMLYSIGLGTLIISSIAPTIYVVCLKPKKVLM